MLPHRKTRARLIYPPDDCGQHPQHGPRHTAAHQLVEYQYDKHFPWPSQEASNARHEVDKDPLKKQLSDFTKLKGNNFHKK